MAAVKKDEMPAEKVVAAPKNLEAQILKALGTPPDYYQTQIVNVGDQRWRCNVRTKTPTTNCVQVTKIAHSFYIKTDDKGKIVGGDEIALTYKQ